MRNNYYTHSDFTLAILVQEKKVQYRKENNIDSMLFDRHVYFVQYHYAAIFLLR